MTLQRGSGGPTLITDSERGASSSTRFVWVCEAQFNIASPARRGCSSSTSSYASSVLPLERRHRPIWPIIARDLLGWARHSLPRPLAALPYFRLHSRDARVIRCMCAESEMAAVTTTDQKQGNCGLFPLIMRWGFRDEFPTGAMPSRIYLWPRRRRDDRQSLVVIVAVVTLRASLSCLNQDTLAAFVRSA